MTEIDIVVELMEALARPPGYSRPENGKFVVTANKDLMAQNGMELLAMLRIGENIFYEASVGGGI